MADELDLTIVIMRFEAAEPARLEAVLANYVVTSRSHPGCRNIDFCASVSHPGRYVVVQKWDSPEAQQKHFDSEEMVRMAEDCRGILAAPPEIDLLAPASAHDLW